MVINLRLLRELTIAAVSTPGYTKLHVTQTTRIHGVFVLPKWIIRIYASIIELKIL